MDVSDESLFAEKAPLRITPLFNTDNDNDEGYRVLKRLVTKTMNPSCTDSPYGEVETCLEEYPGPNGDTLWRRVAVRGRTGSDRVLHASFELPNDESLPAGNSTLFDEASNTDDIMCWAAFPERPDHKLLCVLASPLLLCIWDVYPSKQDGPIEPIGGGEGHAVTLPFEARAIFSLADRHGLLLQRRNTIEDQLAFESLKSAWTTRGELDEEYSGGGGFVLQEPPKPVRLGNVLPSPSGMEMTITPPSPHGSLKGITLPSLFSLKHPLDEVLPVSILEGDSSSSLFSDVREEILFVGVPRWTDHEDGPYEKKEYSQPVCVSYHTQLKRHAIWSLDSAPLPPPTPPLWQVSRDQRVEHGLGDDMSVMHDPHVVSEGNLGRFGVTDPDASWQGTTSRYEALADALGVSSARKSEDAVAKRGGGRSRRSSGLKHPPPSLLSPLPVAKDPIAAESKPKSNVEFSGVTPDKSKPITFSPFADLNAEFALTLLYEEDASPKAPFGPATEIFLASNFDASGNLVLCLLCPNECDQNPCTVRFFSLSPTRVKRTISTAAGDRLHALSANMLGTLPCISAQPVQAAPVPLCFLPLGALSCTRSPQDALATDVMILLRHETRNRMVLCRSGIVLSECVISFENTSSHDGLTFANVVGMRYPVGNCIDYICDDASDDRNSIRGKIHLRFPLKPVCDSALAALDSAFVTAGSDSTTREWAVRTALMIRIDCIKLAQEVASFQDTHQLQDEDTTWSVVRCVFLLFIESRLFQRAGEVSGHQTHEESQDDCWSILLDSDFRSSYDEKHDYLFLGQDGAKEFDSSQDDMLCMTEILLSKIKPTWADSGDDSPVAASTKPLASTLFDALHLLYEESKLSKISSSNDSLRLIGSLLATICIRAGISSGKNNATNNRNAFMGDFLDHYRRDLGTKWLRSIERASKAISCDRSSSINLLNRRMLTSFSRPPSFFERLNSIMGRLMHQNSKVELTGFYDLQDSSHISPAFRLTRALHRAFSALYRESPTSVDQAERDRIVVGILVEEGMTSATELRDELPTSVALPLLEVLHRCRENPNICSSSSWSKDAWSLLGRTDLSRQCDRDSPELSYPVSTQLSAESRARYHDLLADDDNDGITPLEVTSSMIFPNDNRIHEVSKFLRSSRPIFLQVKRALEVSDHDYERLKQERLLVLCRRTLAVPLGRGMLTFGNLSPVPAEPLPIPKLCLSGRVPPTNANLALDTSNCAEDMNVWPEFHNGVAAGFRLPLEENGIKGTVHEITRTWIVYNRRKNEASPQNPGSQTNNESPNNMVDHAHGGVLMALGLRGHLSTLLMTDIYDYLTQGAVTTTVGILIGMSADRRGSCDPAVSKMLCLHIPSLLPASFTAIDVAGPAQAAAVSGIGLLYQGSSHRLMTEFLLDEMGKRPTHDSVAIDREAYTLSCGIALGMVNLAKGNKPSATADGSGWSGLADLDLDERLHRFVVGGIDATEQQRRKEAADRLTNTTGVSVNEGEKSSCLFEGNTINTEITAPGATLALGLMYMKSGNNTIASGLAIPDTHFLLEYVRPDLLLLRVVARSLILWDQVDPTTDWIDAQIPSVIRSTYCRMREAVEIASGVRDKEGPRPAAETSTSHPYEEAVDRQAVRQIYAHVLAGACFGMGLRFAGTGDKRAKAAIFKKVVELRTLREGFDPVSAALRPEHPVLEMCLGCALISLSMVMAGTGDLDTLYVLKLIRWRCDEDTRYGNHMAYGAAIGLLFLGGGRCTIGRAPEDIAALLLAFFPRFPSTTSDNQHHLQALRHCYALAVKHREIRAIDADTGENVTVPVEIGFNESSELLKMKAPCLLMNTSDTPKNLRVASDRYYPLSFNIDEDKSGLTFFVKKRSGHLSHLQDPHSQRSLLVQTGIGSQSVRDLIESFSDDPVILAYAKYLCGVEPKGDDRSTHWVSGFCARVLHDCLTKDTEVAFPLYLKLRSTVVSIGSEDHPSLIEAFWDIRLIQTYYQVQETVFRDANGRLLSAEFVASLAERVERALQSTSMNENDILVYMKTGERRAAFKDEPQGLFGSFLVWYDVPFPSKDDGDDTDMADL